MTCPKCGAQMNHHADKLIETVDEGDRANVDPLLGGVVEAAYACPDCGNVELQPEPPTDH